ncbi:MAG: sigma 54-interacting transcriptional regulator [Myxococcota bacterium]
MASDLTTSDEGVPEVPDGLEGHRVLALAILHAPYAPRRVGEVAFVERGETWVLGRKGDLGFHRHRPRASSGASPLDDGAISRRQVELEVAGPDRVQIVNVGKLPLRVNGRPVDRTTARPGDIIEVGQRLVLLLHRRPRELAGVRDLHPFGRPDAQGLVGEGPLAWTLRSRIEFVADRVPHVLVHGASGTGKELVAQAVHAKSGRARGPLISRNAATIPDSLADAELFGNLKNYPNPGMMDRPGLVGQAHRGVLFLDEFGELPIEVQAKLLRVLDSGEYTRLGEAEPRNADLRLIAATNRDLSDLKHDLLARVPLRIPTPRLGDRREDIGLLIHHLMRRMATEDPALAPSLFENGDLDGAPRITSRFVATLAAHPYQTEIRELQMLLWEALSASSGGPLNLFEHYRSLVAEPTQAPVGPVDPTSLTKDVLQAALDRHGGSQELAWRELGLSSRHVLARLVKRHGLRVRGRRGAASASEDE